MPDSFHHCTVRPSLYICNNMLPATGHGGGGRGAMGIGRGGRGSPVTANAGGLSVATPQKARSKTFNGGLNLMKDDL